MHRPGPGAANIPAPGTPGAEGEDAAVLGTHAVQNHTRLRVVDGALQSLRVERAVVVPVPAALLPVPAASAQPTPAWTRTAARREGVTLIGEVVFRYWWALVFNCRWFTMDPPCW